MPRRRLVLSFAVAAGLALGAVACSSDEGGTATSSTTAAPAASTSIATLPKTTNPATEAGLTSAATAYLEAGNAGKVAEQYAALSTRCLAQWKTADAWNNNVAAATKILGDMGFKTTGGVVESVAVEGFTPEAATVKAVVKTSDGKVIDLLGTTKWVYEDGGWRSDSCDSAM
jgi:hypothetical protein